MKPFLTVLFFTAILLTTSVAHSACGLADGTAPAAGSKCAGKSSSNSGNKQSATTKAPPASYYQYLRDECDRRNRKCCLSSVDYLEKNKLEAPVNGQCKQNQVPQVVVRCSSSYAACVPETVRK